MRKPMSRGLLLLAVFVASFAGSQTPGPAPGVPKRVLLLSHNAGQTDNNIDAIREMLPRWGKIAGFVVTDVPDVSALTRESLSQFDGVIAATSGELPLTADAKQALVDFVEQDGKGIVFLHQSAMASYSWKAWG